MRDKKRYGDPQEVHIGEFSADRTGLFTGSAQRRRPEVFDAPEWEWLALTAAPSAVIPCVGSRRGYDSALSLAIYTYTYEGLIADPPEDSIQFEMDFSMSEEPIQTHPNFATLKETFGWLAAQARFPETDPGGDRSKMYGKESWLSVGAMFRRTYSRLTIPISVMRGIGVILSGQPPGSSQFQLPASYKSGRNWLKMAPKITKRGNAVQVAEEYWLSGPGGWVEEMYSAEALTEDEPASDP